MSEYRTRYQNLGQESKTRLGGLNSQITKYRETLVDLQRQNKEISAERDGFKAELARVAVDARPDQESSKAQIEALIKDKADLEKRLAEAGSNDDAEHKRILVRSVIKLLDRLLRP